MGRGGSTRSTREIVRLRSLGARRCENTDAGLKTPALRLNLKTLRRADVPDLAQTMPRSLFELLSEGG
jgi:hypothetical protein